MSISHWWLGLVSKARPASEVLRSTTIAGGEAKTFRRLMRLGPWGIYVIRYGQEGR